MKFGVKKGQKRVKFGGFGHVYFGWQTYTLFTYTKTYIACSNLLIFKMSKKENLFFGKLGGRGGGGDFWGRGGVNTEGWLKVIHTENVRSFFAWLR